MSHAAIAVLCMLVMAGCVHSLAAGHSAPPGEVVRSKPATPAPAWVTNPPETKDALFAIGVSGPTFYPEDGAKYAAQNARAELGRTISSTVTSALFAEATSGGTYVETASATQMTHDYSEAIVENSQVVATWVDRSGGLSGQAGTTYALVKIDKNKIGAVKAASK